MKILARLRALATTLVGRIVFDQRNGLGAVPNNENIEYKGCVAWMKPQTFLDLAVLGSDPSRVDGLEKLIREGQSLGSPFLILDDSQLSTLGMLRVTGHEGRHRCLAILRIQTDPIPVHLFISGGNYKDFTPEIVSRLNNGIQVEQSRVVVRNAIEKLELNGRTYSKNELSF